MSGLNPISAGSRLILVHGIGGLRDTERERVDWLAALAVGARKAGHSPAVAALSGVDVRFANYSDLFAPVGAQGEAVVVEDGEEDFLYAWVASLLDELAESADDVPTKRAVGEARAQLDYAHAQGLLRPVRQLAAVLAALLQIPGLRRAAQWASGRRLLGALSQVGRYLRRGEPEDGFSLDERIRARVHSALSDGPPAVVVAHSLGSVIAYETLHEYTGPVPLLVTVGSPLATAGVVLHRVKPRPPTTPPTVARWLNFWDQDDIVVARPHLERQFAANAAGVLPDTDRVDSNGVWVHTATKYLAQRAVADPIIEALTE